MPSSSLLCLLIFGLAVILSPAAANHTISITGVNPNVSPLNGGTEVFITGKGFGDSVQAEFSVLPGSLFFAASFKTNNDGTLTASFFAPPSTSTLSSFGSWVRLVDSHAYSGAVSFYWENPVVITTLFTTPNGDRTLYTVGGSGFYTGLRCASPLHAPVKAKVTSSTSLTCNLVNKGTVTEFILIQKSGATVSYSLVKTTGSTGTTGTPASTGTTGTTSQPLAPYFGSATYVYAWSGAVNRSLPDAIIDAVPTSPTYKQVVGKGELPADLATNNEPHHMQFVNNNTIVVAGGLLSLATRPQEIFFWDVSNPVAPRFLKAENPPTSSAVDDVVALPQGGFLVSIMGAMDGSSPGAIGEWDASLNMVGEWPLVGERPNDFNPHGISLNPELDILVTSDFLDPKSTLHPSTHILLRDSIRIWKPWSQRKISSTVRIPEGRGLMDVKFIPKDPDGIAYTSNVGPSGMILWAINTTDSSTTRLLNMSQYYTFSDKDYMLHSPLHDGSKYVITNSYAGLLLMFDVSNPMAPIFLDDIAYGIGSGIHSVEISDDSKFVLVSGYFINEDNMGTIQEDGDRSLHISQVVDKSLVRTNFDVNLNTAVPYPMRPHMIRFFNTKTTFRPL